jgi:hypothetical protein
MTTCLAVGTPAEAWTGTRWSILPNPPAGPLNSVSCPVSGFCQATGPPPIGARPVAARWNGRTWRAERVPRPTPVPPGPPGEEPLVLPASVSCASATSCVTVGATMAERWNGAAWTIQRTPDPA